MRPICKRNGSTTSSIVATSSQMTDASVESHVARPPKVFKRCVKSFLSRASRPSRSTPNHSNIASHSFFEVIFLPVVA